MELSRNANEFLEKAKESFKFGRYYLSHHKHYWEFFFVSNALFVQRSKVTSEQEAANRSPAICVSVLCTTQQIAFKCNKCGQQHSMEINVNKSNLRGAFEP